MPRFAANLTLMYTEVTLLDRFAAAARDGFDAVEHLSPYEHTPNEIAALLKENGLTQALFNLPPGDWAAGDRGMACIPGREAEFAARVDQASLYASATGCQRLRAMAGLKPAGVRGRSARHLCGQPEGRGCLFGASRHHAGDRPINPRDMPNFFLSGQQQAHDVCADVGAINLQLQMDFYHCQIVEGDLSMRLKKHFHGVGQVQIAGVPDRHEPDCGEVNDPHLFDLLDALGYAGFVGCEYRPKAGSSEVLHWWRRYQASKKDKA